MLNNKFQVADAVTVLRSLASAFLLAALATLAIPASVGAQFGAMPASPGYLRFPQSIRMEAELPDFYYDTSAGNSYAPACGFANNPACSNLEVGGVNDAADGSCGVGNTLSGEWLKYNIAAAGATSSTYRLTVRYSAVANGKTMTMLLDSDSSPTISNFSMPNTNDWNNYQFKDAGNFTMAPGLHTIRMNENTGDYVLSFFTADPLLGNPVGNLVPNGGFEANSDWSYAGGTYDDNSNVGVPAKFQDSHIAGYSNGGAGQGYVYKQLSGLTAGAYYDYSFAIQADALGDGGEKCKVYWYNSAVTPTAGNNPPAGGATLGGWDGSYPSTHNWTVFSGQLQATGTTATIVFHVQTTNGGGGHIDNVILMPATNPPCDATTNLLGNPGLLSDGANCQSGVNTFAPWTLSGSVDSNSDTLTANPLHCYGGSYPKIANPSITQTVNVGAERCYSAGFSLWLSQELNNQQSVGAWNHGYATMTIAFKNSANTVLRTDVLGPVRSSAIWSTQNFIRSGITPVGTTKAEVTVLSYAQQFMCGYGFTAVDDVFLKVSDCTPALAIGVTIGAPSPSQTKSGPVTYTVNYTNSPTITLAAGNITLNTTGTATGTVSVSGSGNSARTVTISSITGDGTLGISVAAGTANNGCSAPAAGPSTTFAVDNTAPTAAGGQSVTFGPSGASINFGTGSDAGVGLDASAYKVTRSGYDSGWLASGPASDSGSGLNAGDTAAYTVTTRDAVGNTATSTINGRKPLDAGNTVIFSSGASSLSAPGVWPSTARVYASSDSKLFGFDASAVSQLWAPVQAGGAVQGRMPVATLNSILTVLAGGQDAKVYARKAGDGTSLWTADLGTGYKATAKLGGAINRTVGIYTGDVVFAVTDKSDDTNFLRALKATDGATLWTYQPNSLGPILGSPLVLSSGTGGTVAFATQAGGSDTGKAVLVNIADGALGWSVATTGVASSLSTDGTYIYLVNEGGNLYKIDIASGSVVSGFPVQIDGQTQQGIIGAPMWVGNRGALIVSCKSGNLRVLSAADGSELRSTAISNPSQAIEYQSKIYVGSSDGKLYQYDIDNLGNVVFKTIGNVVGDPVIDAVHSKIYVGNTDGNIYGFSLPF